MFIAQVDEVDYDAKGHRINDINSLAEYVHDVILKRGDKPREDEDDDNARYFHIVKLASYSLGPQVIILPGSRSKEADDKRTLPFNTNQKLHSVFYDVVTPPPRFIG
jgi:hypothetical protein